MSVEYKQDVHSWPYSDKNTKNTAPGRYEVTIIV